MNTIIRDIVKRFCHSIAWVDDEVFSYQAYYNNADAFKGKDSSVIDSSLKTLIRTHYETFQQQCEFFQEKSISCSLIPFQVDGLSFEDRLKAIEYTANICLSHDIVLLDWQLGSTDSGEFCLDIIRKICSSQALHYIFIVTKSSDDIVKHLCYGIDNLETLDETSWLSDRMGHFVRITNKVDVSDLSQFVLDEIVGIPQSVLSWAALDLAEKTRLAISAILATLPQSSDYGIILDHILSKRDDFTKSTIINNLLEDISQRVILEKYPILETSAFTFATNPKLDELSKKLQYVLDFLSTSPVEELDQVRKDQISLFKGYISKIVDDLTNDSISLADIIKAFELNPILLAACSYLHKLQNDLPAYSEIRNSILDYTGFCDSLTINGSQLPNSVCRGNLYKRVAKNKRLYLCISQACDTAKSNVYYFVKCTKLNYIKSSKRAFLYFVNDSNVYSITLSPESLVLVSSDNTNSTYDALSNYSFCGKLRDSIVDNLANRFWNHITRIGINLPLIDRSLRQ